jgi:light-regulated signal transduction histidine kinase (bacteriophytochrome)
MPTEHDTDRSDRLLRTMQPVLSHDLPNQLVALESLVNMLEFDDGPPPAARLRETLQRLQRVVRKTGIMVRFLKELERLGSHQCRLEEIRLAGLIREVKLELRQQLPELALECSLAGDCGTVVADRRLLTQAVVQLLRCLLEARLGSTVKLQIIAQKNEQDTELRGTLTWPAVPPHAAEPNLPPRLRLHKRPEMVLAQEMLAVWGGRLTQAEEHADCCTFALSLAPRSAHA